jgi:putative glutamine amidotransferase
VSRSPIIGISPESEGSLEPLTAEPCFVLKRQYCDAVREAGGASIALPHDVDALDHHLDLVNGVLIPGGGFQFPASDLFAADDEAQAPEAKLVRARFELALVRKALERDLPLLGICGGEQILNAATGGTLVVSIEKECEGAIDHLKSSYRDTVHPVRVVSGTRLHAIVGRDEQPVNSQHRQSVAEAGAGVTVNAIAPDGVIEGIEAAGRRFCVGVQWHPEYLLTEGDRRLFEAFVAAARE